jgi:hypothetical protein
MSAALMLSSSRISGSAASASTVNGEPTTASWSRETDTVCSPGCVQRWTPSYRPRVKLSSTALIPPLGVNTRTPMDSLPDMRRPADS